MPLTDCPICGRKGIDSVERVEPGVHEVECRVCGKYSVSLQAIHHLQAPGLDDVRHLVSGYIRHQHETGLTVTLEPEDIKDILDVVPEGALGES